MMIKKFLCLFVCVALLFCTACSKNDDTSSNSSVVEASSSTSSTVSKNNSSASSNGSTHTYSSSTVSHTSSKYTSIISRPTSSIITGSLPVSSKTVSISSVVKTSSATTHSVVSTPQQESEIIPDKPQSLPPEEETPKDPFTGKDFTFTSIKQVDYFCVKNIPNSDIVYAVTSVIADTDDDIIIGCRLYSDDPNIKINEKTITVPYSYKEQSKTAKITVRHSITKISYELVLKFENDWEMIFEDEFEGTEMDTTVWEHRPEWLRDKGYVNYFSHDMTFLDGEGHLVSRAAPGKKKLWDYSNNCYKEVDAYLSGAVSTKDLFTTTYGYFEANVKLHHQTGMWGAFWLVCGDMGSSDPVDDGLSINGCEIDVFESLYNHGGVSQNLHWDGFTGHTNSAPSNGYVTQIDTFDGGYHKFAVSWTPNEYVFLVDGVVTRRISADKAGGICNQPGYMLITTECGTWAGKWVLKEGEYSDMLVDYVRVYSLPNKSN